MSTPARRPRLQFDCPDEIRLAIRLRAVKARQDQSHIIIAALREFMPDEIAEAGKILASEPPAPPSRRGRKPKPK